MNTLLEQIRDFADQAHGDQMRKYTGERYIVHPERVMKLCSEYTADEAMLAAALLHDVVEDTPTGPADIKVFLSTLMPAPQVNKTLTLVLELTDVYTKDAFPQWNRGKRKQKELGRLKQTGADSQTIKYADIIDNCLGIVRHDRHFAALFLRECKQILTYLNKGNKLLHQKALETVIAGLKLLAKK